MKNRRMPNGTYGGVRGRKTKVGRKLSFSSYSIRDRKGETARRAVRDAGHPWLRKYHSLRSGVEMKALQEDS